jgi:hypothetical protein
VLAAGTWSTWYISISVSQASSSTSVIPGSLGLWSVQAGARVGIIAWASAVRSA